MKPTNKQTAPEKNEGEGNKTADRNYRAGVEQHLKTHNVDEEARKAAAALDDDKEREALKAAEAAGKRRRK